MGRHFSVEDGNLYIFTTMGDVMLNLNAFPGELNLFEAESSWRISPWVAVVEDVLHRQLENAQIILQLHGYDRVNAQKEALEAYFLEGDERRLMKTIKVAEAELVELASIEGGEKD
ncbi:hypothetical protein KAT55_09875 [Candidatus Bathyarchaeota archaeon]|nr:hypothetical protein [Candidatus Bathyarchaeota archaeon]